MGDMDLVKHWAEDLELNVKAIPGLINRGSEQYALQCLEDSEQLVKKLKTVCRQRLREKENKHD